MFILTESFYFSGNYVSKKIHFIRGDGAQTAHFQSIFIKIGFTSAGLRHLREHR